MTPTRICLIGFILWMIGFVVYVVGYPVGGLMMLLSMVLGVYGVSRTEHIE